MLTPSDPIFNEEIGKWEINLYDDQGNVQDIEQVDGTEEEALERLEALKKRESQKAKKEEKDNLEKESTFLEEQLSNSELPSSNDVFGDIQDPQENAPEEIAEHDKEFKSQENSSKEEAKALLQQTARIYFDANMIDENEYLKYKMQIEEKSLASLNFQLDVTRRAVHKLSEKIHTGEATPRHYEVLTGMQRIILDITKYQQDHIRSIEQSMKEASEQMGGSEASEDEGEGNRELIGGGDRKALVRELNQIAKDTDEEKVPKSKNQKLHDENDDEISDEIEDRQFIEDSNDAGEEGANMGLQGWGDSKEQKKDDGSEEDK